nr:Gp49 family protein [Moraxella osloensis]
MKRLRHLSIAVSMAIAAMFDAKRVTKEFLESEIDKVEYTRIGGTLTHCIIYTHDGFAFTGESACVDPAQFDEEIGKQIAYKVAFDKMYMPYGFWLHKTLQHQNQAEDGENKTESQQLTFGNAIEQLKLGKTVARQGWNGKGMFLSLVKGRDTDYHVNSEVFGTGNDGNSQDQLPVLDAIYMKTADNKLVPWLASQTDMLSEDWQVVNA